MFMSEIVFQARMENQMTVLLEYIDLNHLSSNNIVIAYPYIVH